MLTFITIVHVFLCVFMIFVILLQPGKDAGMGGALGGGAATSAFGGRGAVTFLSKITAVCAALFFITSLGLSFAGLKSSVAAGSVAAKKKPVSAAAGADGGMGADAGLDETLANEVPASMPPTQPAQSPADAGSSSGKPPR